MYRAGPQLQWEQRREGLLITSLTFDRFGEDPNVHVQTLVWDKVV